VKDVKIIDAGDSGRRFKTSCRVEYARQSDDELAGLYSSCDVFVLPRDSVALSEAIVLVFSHYRLSDRFVMNGLGTSAFRAYEWKEHFF